MAEGGKKYTGTRNWSLSMGLRITMGLGELHLPVMLSPMRRHLLQLTSIYSQTVFATTNLFIELNVFDIE